MTSEINGVPIGWATCSQDDAIEWVWTMLVRDHQSSTTRPLSPELRAFYEWQARTRPDWHIDPQELVEVDDCVVVRALAHGTISKDEQGQPLAAPSARAVEWLAAYRLADGLITRIDVLALRPRTG